MEHVTKPHDDALVITVEINGYDVRGVLLNSENSKDILFLDAFTALGNERII